jgi:hypothetical protein
MIIVASPTRRLARLQPSSPRPQPFNNALTLPVAQCDTFCNVPPSLATRIVTAADIFFTPAS